ncbi:hypothetical protein ACTVPL_14050 [Serratia marcescens]|uniref:hypothetical protein n=1 Tax=Serratia marcescens TaxID=615 RepID=UPI0024C4B76D|nr:hypothetical protein [Serratia marcescens]MDK1708253.1 hypothetical protein [Serratia marcescens]HEB0051931.1 hypothetical protein [Serratia marcescens]HEB0089905.1 hypothetical protein [Serratia marcescens]HEE0389302.1 hypothetical protein [Serratia marcescens]
MNSITVPANQWRQTRQFSRINDGIAMMWACRATYLDVSASDRWHLFLVVLFLPLAIYPAQPTARFSTKALSIFLF